MKDSTQNRQPQYVDALQTEIDQFEIARERQITRDQRKSFWAHQWKRAVALRRGDFGSQSDNNHRSSVYFAGLQLDQPGERQQRLEAIRQLRQKEARQQEEEIRQQILERRRQKDEERVREQEEELMRQQEELTRQQEELMRQQEELMRQQEEEQYRQQEEEHRREKEEARRRMQAEEEFKRQREAEEEIRRQYEDLRRQQEQRTRFQEEATRARARDSRNKAKVNTRVEYFAQIERYHLRWTNLRSRRDPQATPLTFQQIPWPVFDPVPKKPADLSARRIKRFISYPDRPLIELGGVTGILKVELLRWHPDKIGLLLACVQEEDRDAVKEGLEVVARILTDMKQV